jgi:hypothetical protein
MSLYSSTDKVSHLHVYRLQPSFEKKAFGTFTHSHKILQHIFKKLQLSTCLKIACITSGGMIHVNECIYLRLLGYYLTTKNKAVVKNMNLTVEFCKISSLCSLTKMCGSPTQFIAKYNISETKEIFCSQQSTYLTTDNFNST